jgi:DNA topoisomerase-1
MCPAPAKSARKKPTAPSAPPDTIAPAIPAPIDSARAAGLRYVYDTRPGITRHRTRTGFRYTTPDNKPLRVRNPEDKEILARIKSLVIPPAWESVWICPIPNGHLQATGRDARGRKQSRYHPKWREVRDQSKYEHMLAFGATLPTIRERVNQHLTLPGLPREKVLATLVRLLETTFIRIGNEAYARENNSFGLTTLRRRHVDIKGSRLTFKFKGKSGVEHTINLTDRRLARIVKTCRDIPGYELFEYLDDDGNAHSVDSASVNDYLREISNENFTAKDFRTWAGTVLAAMTLRDFEPCDTQTQLKKNLVEAVKTVSKRLGNTPSVCRKCYIHPAVVEAYLTGAMTTLLADLKPSNASHPNALRPEESTLMYLLEQQLAQAAA